ncbi:MAG: cytochrome c, partial [Gammaproteobacteria bacterium]|nr:cytochrome c [Gammaproteobacteria bacterium]
MRWIHFILVQCLLIVIAGGLVYMHEDKAALIRTPPASLAQWYQPENERQVWLHNMFNLRREMQAVEYYADNKDAEHLEKWVTRLNEHYLKIAEMVPEWDKKLDKETMANLMQSASTNRYQDVSLAVDKLNQNCKSCHTDFRTITATMYRAPDFSSMEINPSTSYTEHMKTLIKQVNQIKIASEDGMKDLALSSLSDLTKGMNVLGETCSNSMCHKNDTKAYPDNTMTKTITNLEQSLKTGTLKEQGKE